jgi:protein involved in polysaccharide export with SLBB domain
MGRSHRGYAAVQTFSTLPRATRPLTMTTMHRLLVLLMLVVCSLGAAAQSTGAGDTASGPVRLRQTAPLTPPAGPFRDNDPNLQGQLARPADPPYRPGEFEAYVQKLATPPGKELRPQERRVEEPTATGDSRQQGTAAAAAPRPQFEPRLAEDVPQIRRFGAELITRTDEFGLADVNPMVPPDYLISAGDEIVVTLWGSVDADVRAMVDRSGRITIPRVGPVMVAGTRYADLADVVRRRVAQVFRNFDLSVSLGQLRGIRIFVTGFVSRPGAYSVSSLSTVLHGLIRAGGPSSAGSFRAITVRRGAQAPVTYDLYDFLLRGDRSADRVLQADDVIHVGPVGPQIGVIGSVNKPAVFELKAGETVADAIAMAGGFTAVADRSRIAVEKLDARNDVRISQLPLPQSALLPLANGDVLRAFSAIEVTLSVQRQNKRVRVEGEVLRPGEYVLPAASSISQAIAAAGGLTPSAYVFGTEFTRESVRIAQQDNYERALRDLETQFTLQTSTQRTSTADEAAAANARAGATTRLVERLRAIRPNGRVVLQMDPDVGTLPDLALEDGDRIHIPPRPTTVGVFGSVFNGGSYLHASGRSLDEYLRLAGGPTKGADAGSTFVIRANGSVVSGRQSSSWLRDGSIGDVPAQPGDTVFVPEEINKTTFVQAAKDWTQILYQFGVGLAAIATFRN